MKKTLLLLIVLFLLYGCGAEEEPITIPETVKIIKTVTVEVTKVVEKEKIIYLDATPTPIPSATWTPTPVPTATPTAVPTATPISVTPPSVPPPFAGTVWIPGTSDILNTSDPTFFRSLNKITDAPRQMFDRRTGTYDTVIPFLFEADFADGLKIEVQVNSEFETRDSAEAAALIYLYAVGQLPTELRQEVDTIWLHKGDEDFGGGNNNLLIHHERGLKYIDQEVLEEIFLHEASHTSLDPHHYGEEWEKARSADANNYISIYATHYREDIAETFPMYYALRYKASRVSPDLLRTIQNTVPNRINYFDQFFSEMEPAPTHTPTPTIPSNLDDLKSLTNIFECNELGVKNEAFQKFIFANESYERIDDDYSGTGICGTYARLPVENAWHTGSIKSRMNGQYFWTNDANTHWNLEFDLPNLNLSSMSQISETNETLFELSTDLNNPYQEKHNSFSFPVQEKYFSNLCPILPTLCEKKIPPPVKINRALRGYLSTNTSMSLLWNTDGTNEPAGSLVDSNFGQSFYTGIWSTFDKYQPTEFQRGHGTWIIPDNSVYQEPLCPTGTVARDNWPERGPSYHEVFQTIEGGPGYWGNTRFPDPQMKYRINAVTDCYTTQTSSPGWNWGGTDNLQNQAGLAQISNVLLYPPDGITFKRGTHGDFLGQAWMSLPLTANQEPSKGIHNWTLFLNAANFSGATVYMVPEGWDRITDGYAPAEGRGLNSRLPKGDRSWSLSDEIGVINGFQASYGGKTYTRIPQMNYPVDSEGRTIYHQDFKTYSQSSIYEDILDSINNATALSSKRLDSQGAITRSISSAHFGWKLSKELINGLEEVLEAKTFLDGRAWGLNWITDKNAGVFPQYFEKNDPLGEISIISEENVPPETRLVDTVFAASDTSRFYLEPSGGWPTPENGLIYTAELNDGSTISYGWYLFVEQPAIRKLNLSTTEKAQLQSIVEAIHAANWSPANPVLAPPTIGKLAEIDEALILSPPEGMEIGYVPIALSQIIQP